MKTTLAFLLCSVLAFGMTVCGQSSTPSSANNAATEQSGTTQSTPETQTSIPSNERVHICIDVFTIGKGFGFLN